MTNVTETTTTELLPLLTKASELLPEFCLREQTQGNHTRFVLGGLGYTIDIVDGQDISPIDYHVLQGAVQDAIRDRHWLFDLVLSETIEVWYNATVYYDKPAYGTCQKNGSECPVIALLTVFVSALEGQG